MGLKNIFEANAYALDYAQRLADAQPRGDYSGYSIFQLPTQSSPTLQDSVPLAHQADGNTYQAPLSALASILTTAGVVNVTSPFTGLIYNYGYYVNTQLPNTGIGANSAALTSMLNAMGGATVTGGYAYIPQQNYQINWSVGGYVVPDQSIIQALGGGGQPLSTPTTTNYHFYASGDGTMFTTSNTSVGGGHTNGGVYFNNLALGATSASVTTTTAILAGVWNTRAYACTFDSFPCAFACGGNLSCGLDRSTITYVKATVPNNAVAVQLGGSQPFAIGPGEYFQTSQALSGASGCSAIGMGYGPGATMEHATIKDLHLSHWSYDINYSVSSASFSSCNYSQITNCEMSCWNSAVILQPPSTANNGTIFSEIFTGCTMFKDTDANTTDPIVVIAASSPSASSYQNIQNIHFVGCTIFNNVHGTPGAGVYGVSITSGDDILFTGCTISNMGTTSNGSANVRFGGAGNPSTVGRVMFTGCDLRSKLVSATNNNPSQYAIFIDSSAVLTGPITFTGCNFGVPGSGYLVLPATVTGGTIVTNGTFFINNCPGYNDQQTAINVVGNIGTSARAAYNQGGNSGTSYFGPSYVFYTGNAGGSTLKINGGSALTLAASQTGVIWLNSPYDTFQFNAAPSAIQWIGE